MALRELNLGTAANSGDGDNLRAAATKIKENFAEIYADDFVTSARIADDVALGGNPTTTTQNAGDNSTKIATTAYADTAVANAIDAAPAALDTLNELAASLNDDADFAGTMTTSLAGKLSTAAGAVGTSNIADDAVTIAKIADAAIVTESEGIASNDNDTTLPTSAAVKDYVDSATDNDTLGALTATDGGFVVGNGSAFAIETGSTARDSIGLGTSGHIQFHCLGVGEAASTNNGQIDATTVYADTFGKDSGDYINWTTDTQMDFYVNGSNEMRLEADGDLHVDGDVIAASTTVSSDEKLKDNIKPIFAPLETLEQIKGVDFNWKKDGSKSSGVIAQDIQKVMPHLVKEVKSLDSDDSHLTVDYNGLIGLLIESVKTLSEKVEKLENN